MVQDTHQKGGDIEFFTSGDNVLFTGPSGIETSCSKKISGIISK